MYRIYSLSCSSVAASATFILKALFFFCLLLLLFLWTLKHVEVKSCNTTKMFVFIVSLFNLCFFVLFFFQSVFLLFNVCNNIENLFRLSGDVYITTKSIVQFSYYLILLKSKTIPPLPHLL